MRFPRLTKSEVAVLEGKVKPPQGAKSKPLQRRLVPWQHRGRPVVMVHQAESLLAGIIGIEGITGKVR